jgi:hypothetical protein
VTEWWHYPAGIGLLLLLFGIRLLPNILYMIELRKLRGLWGYDAKQFVDVEKRKQDED